MVIANPEIGEQARTPRRIANYRRIDFVGNRRANDIVLVKSLP